MAVPSALLQQLLALGESERVEIAHALLESVDEDDGATASDREKLHAALERSIQQVEAGQTIPFEDVIASIRAKRASRATR